MMIAEKEGLIVGFINASIEKDDGNHIHKAYRRVSIDDLCVNQKKRRRGIGKELLQSVEKWAEGKGIAELTIIVFNFNKIAMHFYADLSYKPITTRLTKHTINRES